jgi:hypothetical protein
MNYQKIYNQIIERAKTRQLEGYKEKHHIIPKCLGGNNNKENLVELTAREHFLCHRLLCEIYPNEIKLAQALWLMMIGKNKQNNINNYQFSSRTYEYVKFNFIEKIKGKKMSLETKEKIKKTKLGTNMSDFYTKEVRKKMSEGKKGKAIHTEESKKKISESKKGKNRKITWGNKISESKKGKNKKGKAIIQIHPITKEIINVFSSITEAIKVTGIKSISNNLIGKTKTSGGYIWKYKNN